MQEEPTTSEVQEETMTIDALAPTHATSVAEVPIPDGAPSAIPATPLPLREHAASLLHARGVSPASLLTFALAFAATAACVLLLHHPGMAAILGFVALAAAELAKVPAGPAFRDAKIVIRSTEPLIGLLFVGGIVGGVAGRGSIVVLVLALIVFVVEAWLPLLRAVGGPLRLPDAAALWTHTDRLALLLLGALVGRIGPSLLFVAAIGLFDAWLRVERLAHPAGLQPKTDIPWLKHILREDSTFEPVFRWLSLAAAALALFLLPVDATWMF